MKGLTDQSTTEYPSWDSSLQDHQGSHTEAVLNVIFGDKHCFEIQIYDI